jgi:DNA-binding response OmpR family regulator
MIVQLSRREAHVAALLSAAPGPLSRWQLIDAMQLGFEDDGVVRLHICRLRDKLGDDAIRTLRGVGYELTDAGRKALKQLEMAA